MHKLLQLMDSVAREAGDAILRVYEEDDFGIKKKNDNSPLTRADLAAHHIIVDSLQKGAPGIPVLSEESGDITWEERSRWTQYFLVDPLDGTKEFIRRNGEFTVNIALIDKGVPLLGIVYAPVRGIMYTGDQSCGVASVRRHGKTVPISTRAIDPSRPLTVVASRRHGMDALQKCMTVLENHFSEIETTNMGSSLKLCLVAEGKADLYPRLAPTSEWDTASAQAVVEAAGGIVVDTDLAPLRYNTKADILNPFFYVISDANYDWEFLPRTAEIRSG